MQTCSNCGATSREGAKFCTTCGSRLNAVVDPTASSGWESPATDDETRFSPVVSPDNTEQRQDEPSVETTDEPVAVEKEPATTSWSWGQATATEVPEEEPIAADMTEALDVSKTGDDEIHVTEPAEGESLSSWASQWSESTPESEEAGEVESIATSRASETTGEAEDEYEEPSPQARAHALLYELRELIDSTVPDQESAPGVAAAVVEGGKENALATLTAVPGDEERFDNLRAILESAREQPRDVDTMLNLLGEINSLIALIDSHEAYVSAINTAIGQLRGDEP